MPRRTAAHRHLWNFHELRYRTPQRVSPVIEVVYQCAHDPRHTFTRALRPRVPNPDALTDEERFERAAERRRAVHQRTRPRPVSGASPPTDLPWEQDAPGTAPGEVLGFADQVALGRHVTEGREERLS